MKPTTADTPHGIGGNLLGEAAWSCVVGVVLFAATLWVTRPLASGPWDQIANSGDALYTAWALDHNYQILATNQWGEYWRAPMFTPYPHSLALADAHLGTALWTWPIYWATRSAVFTQNIAIFSSFVLTAIGCYLLAMHVTARRWLALILAVAGMAIPFRLAHLEHLQILMTQWLLFSVWCLLRCARKPHWRYVLAFGANCVMTLTSSLYYGVFQVLLLVPLGLALGLRHGWYRPDVLLRAWVWVGLATCVVSLPFLIPYHMVYAGEVFERTLEEIMEGSARPGDLLNVTPRHWLARFPGISSGPVELTLFPGVTLAAGAVLTLLAAARDHHWWRSIQSWGQQIWCWARQQRELTGGIAAATILVGLWLAHAPFNVTVNLKHDFMRVPWPAVSGSFFLVLGVSALLLILPRLVKTRWLQQRGRVFWCWCGLLLFILLSLGPMIRCHTTDLALGPYALLYRFMPGFKSMRVPGRLCLLFLPLLVVLAAHAYDRLLAIASPQVVRRATVALIAIGLAVDLAVDPYDWQRVQLEDDLPTVFQWLRNNGEPGGVLVLPTDELGRYRSPLYLYYALHHRRPLLNGYAAFMPSECHAALLQARAFPEPATLQILRTRGIRYVVLDVAKLNEDREHSGTAALIAECDKCSEIHRMEGFDEQFLLYEILIENE